MPRTHQEASQGAVCLTPWAVICSDGPEPRNPQASYYRARYYDPAPGRFLSEDRIRFGAGENFYTYTNNSPVRYTDPMGLAGCDGLGIASCQARCKAQGLVYASCTHIDVYLFAFNICGCKDPCGDCTPIQHAGLQNAVNLACSGPSACKASQTCAELAANMATNLGCAAARNAINKTCYGGGDAGHREAAANATAAASKCALLMVAKGCK